MSPVIVVVTDVLVDQAFQMTLIEHDHMIEAFGNTVLPGTSETGPFGFDTQGFDRTYYILIEVRRPIEDQIFRRGIIRECLSQLLRDP